MSSTGDKLITKEFLEQELGEEITSFSVKAGSKDGDNYMSVMYAVELTLKSGKKRNVILKTYPTLPARQEILSKCNIFHTELEVYKTWIPELMRVQRDAGIKTIFEPAYAGFITGKSIDFSIEGSDKQSSPLDNYIMMEDLRASGYQMHSRHISLDLDHVTLVVKELAKVHALSWCYKKIYNQNSLSEKYPFLDPPMIATMMEEMKMMLGTSFETSIKILGKKFGSNSPIVQGVANFEEHCLDVITTYWTAHVNESKVDKYFRIKPTDNKKEEQWEVLLHRDIWVNNMLFKYEEGSTRPIAVKLVDLQIVHEGDPTGDISYVMHTSTDTAFRNAHTDTFLQQYCDSFMQVCNAFNIAPLPGFSFAEMKQRYNRAKIFGLGMAVPCYPIMLKAEGKAVNLEKMDSDMESKDFFKSIAEVREGEENPIHVKRLVDIAAEMYEAGVI